MSVIFFYDKKEVVPFFYLTPSRWSGELPPPYDSSLLPQHYLEFAIKDLEDKTSRGLVNAFSNVKRCLHFMIDSLLHQYGVFQHYKKTNFPTKLRLLDMLGIIPITLMKNLNVERNLLEHEYSLPSKRRVDEAVDVAKLILMATERITESLPTEVVAGWNNPRKHVVIQLEPNAGEIRMYGLKAKGKYHKIQGMTCFKGPLRSFFGDKLSKGVTLSKKPWRTIVIRKSTESEWQPILRELVNMQRKNNQRRSSINQENATITIPVTIPLHDLPQESWATLLDKALAEAKESERSEPSKTGVTGKKISRKKKKQDEAANKQK
jgi:hypothetical protein